ncbi:C4-dicarboxylate transport protein [Striga asiatica]|uniref:C4-dicarboxylate transport protein n=1 Tax=Striga asiatica TaxID=4170 RepID=A0A5A7QHS3_STRAF|nr:C4-dicarboxylate transport protein [Striga asiatica]
MQLRFSYTWMPILKTISENFPNFPDDTSTQSIRVPFATELYCQITLSMAISTSLAHVLPTVLSTDQPGKAKPIQLPRAPIHGGPHQFPTTMLMMAGAQSRMIMIIRTVARISTR